MMEKRLKDCFKAHVAEKNAEVEAQLKHIEEVIDLFHFQRTEVMLAQKLRKIGFKFPSEQECVEAQGKKLDLIELKNDISACESIINNM